jgi:K+-transporting ATPase c subunit
MEKAKSRCSRFVGAARFSDQLRFRSLDPDISPEAAEVQIPRVSRATGISEQNLRDLVAKHVEEKELGLFGERRVNVLKLNMDVQSRRVSG